MRSDNNPMRDLYKFIYLHSLAVVCEESFDKNLNEPKLCGIKISDGKLSDTFVLTLDEREILIFNRLYNHYVWHTLNLLPRNKLLSVS